MSLRLYPPFELQAAYDTRRSLASGIVAYHFGSPGQTPWLFDGDGAAFPVLIAERSLEFKFEVFSLDIPSEQELQDRHACRTTPALPDDIPDELRALTSKQPLFAVPPPTAREPWPFLRWRLEVLRRVEFIVEGGEVPGAVGSAPNTQGADRPGNIPLDAAAACEVDAGLLFTDLEGGRLLIAVDWMPYDMVVSRDPKTIDDYVEACVAIPVENDPAAA